MLNFDRTGGAIEDIGSYFNNEISNIPLAPLPKPAIMIYTPDGRVGSFQASEYQRLITMAVTREVTTAVEKAAQAEAKKNLKGAISKGLQEGKKIEDILREL